MAELDEVLEAIATQVRLLRPNVESTEDPSGAEEAAFVEESAPEFAKASLKSEGIDGLALWSVVAELERQAKRTVPDAEIEACSTVGELAALFA